MCGINGFTGRDPDLLRRMHGATHHRGPDDEGFWETDDVSFAHNRLSIIDLSPGGHQPMVTPDGRYTIVFNGEIYNYRELRQELESFGERFVSSSDTEVLLRVFSRWGEEGLARLNGIFAFGLWDRDTRVLRLVRDPLGVKPLYYFIDGTRLLFSSELRSLLSQGMPREIHRDALNAYARLLYVPGDQTMVAGIRKLLPGQVLAFQKGRVEIRPFWVLKEGAPVTSYEEAVEGVRTRTQAAVRRQLVSDRPVGVFLSGGIDSSAVLGMAREATQAPLKAFTVSYTSDVEEERYNKDAELAALTAKYFSVEHHVVRLDAAQAAALLEPTANFMDEPVANHVQTSTYLLAKFAKPHITVALGGDGGDELFGGYPRYWYARLIERLHQYPLPWNILKSFSSETLRKFGAAPGVDRHLAFVAQKEADVASLLPSGVNDPSATARLLSPFFSDTWQDQTNRLMAGDVRTWLPEESFIRTDRLTMAHALEQRVPLLDLELVEYAFRIPSSMKVATREKGKRVFIDAVKPWLPVHLLTEEKRAWNSPMAKWIRGPLLPLVKEILSPQYAQGSEAYLDFPAIHRLLEAHVQKRRYTLAPVWAAVTFQLWYRQFMMGLSRKN